MDARRGKTQTVAVSGLPHGSDLGVESEGFVPAGFGAGWNALLADRVTPGSPNPGDDVILALGATGAQPHGCAPG